MGPYVLVNVLFVGFLAFAAMHHLAYWAVDRRERINLAFGLGCGAGAAYIGLNVATMAAQTLDGFRALALARDAVGVGVSLPLLALLYALVSGLRVRPLLIALTAACWLLVALEVFVLGPGAEALERETFPWGEGFVTGVPLPHPAWTAGVFLALLVTRGVGVVAAVRLWGRDRTAAVLVGAAAGSGAVFTALNLMLLEAGSKTLYQLGTGAPLLPFVVFMSLHLLRVYARRGAELAASDERFRGIFDHTRQFIGLLRPDGTLLISNRTALEFVGARPEDVVGRPFWDTPWWAHAPDLQARLRDAVRAAAGGAPQRLEVTHPGADGALAHVDFSLTPVRDAAGRVKYLLPEGRDVTGLRRSEERFRALFDAAPYANAVSDLSGRYVAVNRAFLAATGLTSEQVLGRTQYELGFAKPEPGDREVVRALLATGGVDGAVRRTATAEGGERVTLYSARAFEFDGQPHFLSCTVDITKQVLAEEALRESEALLRMALVTAGVGVYRQDLASGRVELDDRGREIYGFERPVTSLAELEARWHPDDAPRVRDEVARAVAHQAFTFASEHRILLPDGTVRWLAVRAQRVGDPGEVIGTLLDLTERRRAEDALRESERRLAVAIGATSDAVWEWRYQTGEAYYSPRWYEMLGLPPDRPMTFGTWEALCHPDDRGPAMQAIQRALDAPDSAGFAAEFRMRHADGGWRHILGRGNVVERDSDGRPRLLAGTNTDVTDRVRAGAAVREAEYRQRLALDAGRMGTWDWDVVRGTVVWDARQQELLGFPPGAYDGHPDTFFSRLHPADAARVRECVARSVATGEDYEAEFRVCGPDGATRWLAGRGRLIRGADGRPARMIGINHDVTERVRAEAALRESEERFRTLIDDLDVGVVLQDAADRVLVSNPAAARVLGLTEDQLRGVTSRDPRWNLVRADGSDLPAEEVPSVAAARTGRPVRDVILGATNLQSGGRIWLQVSASPRLDPDGAVSRVLVTLLDVSERVRAEGARRAILDVTSRPTGDDFFRNLTCHLTAVCGVRWAVAAEIPPDEPGVLRSLAVAADGAEAPPMSCRVEGSPCQDLFAAGVFHVPTGARERYPADDVLRAMGVDSYLGHLLTGADGRPVGALILVHDRPLPDPGLAETLLRVIAARAGAELERARADAALRAREARFRALIENSSEAIALYSPAGDVLYQSPSIRHVLGFEPAELVGRNSLEFVHPDDAAGAREALAAAVAAPGAVVRREVRLRAKGGGYRWVELVGTNQLADPAVGALVGNLRDVTERRGYEDRLRERDALLQKLSEQVPGMIYQLRREPDGRMFMPYASEGIRDMLELAPGDVRESVGPLFARVHPDDREPLFDSGRESAERLAPWHAEYRVLLPAGGPRWREGRAAPERLPDGGTLWHGYIGDVTARKEAEQRQAALIRDLERRNAEMEQFTYTASHDLKSPLVTIKGFVGALEMDLEAGDAGLVQSDIARIKTAADRMLALLDDLLELSRVGRAAQPPRPVPLGEVVREAWERVAGPARAAAAELHAPPDLPAVMGDRPRLVAVFQNLFENAIKYGGRPRPVVEVGTRPGGGAVVCFVRDNGPGIDPRHHERVFGLFEKLDQKSPGTGIGLALVRKIVDVHGGRVWVESQGAGAGSAFVVSLPAAGGEPSDG